MGVPPEGLSIIQARLPDQRASLWCILHRSLSIFRMDDREDKLSQFTVVFFDDGIERRTHYPLAFGFEAKALPDKTLDKLNSFINLLPESQAHHSLRDGFPTLRFKKRSRNITARRQDVPRFSSCNSFSRNFFSLHERRRDYSYTGFLEEYFFPDRG